MVTNRLIQKIIESLFISSHSAQFNGADSSFTDTARRIVEKCHEALDEHDKELTQLENDIAAAKKAAEAEATDIMSDTHIVRIGIKRK